MDDLINKQDFPRPAKFLHYIHPILGSVCIDEYCEHVAEEDPHAHPRGQQKYND